ncbi:uncharacterized protein [Macaca nemestrina]|uniref:uncharacterized protein n=1 Tax=Macaca nemestrina TaxID=9545 RepID=UPI0039B97508
MAPEAAFRVATGVLVVVFQLLWVIGVIVVVLRLILLVVLTLLGLLGVTVLAPPRSRGHRIPLCRQPSGPGGCPRLLAPPRPPPARDAGAWGCWRRRLPPATAAHSGRAQPRLGRHLSLVAAHLPRLLPRCRERSPRMGSDAGGGCGARAQRSSAGAAGYLVGQARRLLRLEPRYGEKGKRAGRGGRSGGGGPDRPQYVVFHFVFVCSHCSAPTYE